MTHHSPKVQWTIPWNLTWGLKRTKLMLWPSHSVENSRFVQLRFRRQVVVHPTDKNNLSNNLIISFDP